MPCTSMYTRVIRAAQITGMASRDSAHAAQALLSGPSTCTPHSGLDSCLLEAQASEHCSLGLGSALLVKAIVEPRPL